MEGRAMKIYYDDGTDLLYLRFDEREQQVENRKVAEDVVHVDAWMTFRSALLRFFP